MNHFLIECCANSIKSAVQGELGGANRIEFCADLEVGGITPLRKDISKLKKTVSLPIRILIRPRAGDFIYSEKEMLEMISDIQFCKKIHCDGVVIGSLNKNRSINIEQTKRLVNIAIPMHVTFHRAFDHGNNLQQNLKDVIACGCNTVLTSGQNNNINTGINNLKELIKLAKNHIIILSGGGVNHKNADTLYKIGIRNFHLSGSIKRNGLLETSSQKIKAIIDKLKEIV